MTKPRLPLCFVKFCLLCTAMVHPAQAGPKVVEFQLTAAKLITWVSNELRIRAEDLCISQFEWQGRTYVVDHLEVPTMGGRLAREEQTTAWPPGDNVNIYEGPYQIHRVQVAVPVVLFLKDPACVNDPTCPPNEYAYDPPPQIMLFFNLFSNGYRLCLSFSHAEYFTEELDLPPDKIPPDLTKGICQRLNLDPLNEHINSGLPNTQPSCRAHPGLHCRREVTNTGVSADDNLTRIAFRVEFDGETWTDYVLNEEHDTTPPDPSWIGFFDGQLAPGLDQMTTKDFTVFVDEPLFTDPILRRFYENLAASPRFDLEGIPTGYWIGMDASGGMLQIVFSGDVHTGLEGEVCTTVGVDPAIASMLISVDPNVPDTINTHGVLSYDLDDDDVSLCSGLQAFLLPVLTHLAIIAETYDPDPEDLDYPAICTPLSDTEFACTEAFSLPNFGGGVMTINQMYGHAAGPVFGGSWSVQPWQQHGRMTIQSDGFEYGVHGFCEDLFGVQTAAWIGHLARVRLDGPGVVCQDIEIIDDPLGMFSLYSEAPRAGDPLTSYFGIRFPTFPDDPNRCDDPYDRYFRSTSTFQNVNCFDPNIPSRYPCRVRIVTSVGSRTIEIPAPVEPAETFDRAIIDKFLSNPVCPPPPWLPVDPLGGGSRFNPLWVIDPPPIDVVIDILMDDPPETPQVVMGQLADIRLIVDETPVGNKTGISTYDLPGANFRLEAIVTTDFSDVIPSAGGFSSPKSANAAKQAGTDPLVIPISIPMAADLVGRTIGDDTTAALAFAQTVSAEGQLPQDQLPAGIRAASFQFDLNPNTLTFVGKLPEPFAEPQLAAQPMANTGFCGTGVAGMTAFAFLGLAFVRMSMPRPRRIAKTISAGIDLVDPCVLNDSALMDARGKNPRSYR